MGNSNRDNAVYFARMSAHAAAGTDVFSYHDDVRSGRVTAQVHELVDPSLLNRAGLNIRESRDSEAHPNSLAVAIFFDTTGSMYHIPRAVMNQLPNLHQTLIDHQIADPHILFGAINDATTSAVAPLQVGQFEAGNEMDDALSSMLLEGGGGGSSHESYELAMYYMARHTELDCLTKRNQKGIMFIIGDERPYDQVSHMFVNEYIKDGLQSDVSTDEILDELQTKYEVFWVMPEGAAHSNDRYVLDYLERKFGQRLLRMRSPESICEVIAQAIDSLGLASDQSSTGTIVEITTN